MKCLKCGAFMLSARRGVPLRDGAICNKCCEALGFDIEADKEHLSWCHYDEIKNGRDAYIEKRKAEIREAAIQSVSVQFAHYGERRDLNATDEEKTIFEILQEMSPKELEFCRVSENYVTAKLGEWDVARFKYTDRARWIKFPTVESSKEKHLLESPDDVRDFDELVKTTLAHIEKYS